MFKCLEKQSLVQTALQTLAQTDQTYFAPCLSLLQKAGLQIVENWTGQGH